MGNRLRLALAALALGCAVSCGPPEVKPDETVVFFATAARQDLASGLWIVPIHGWIYEPVVSTHRSAALAAVLEAQFGLSAAPETQANFERRVNLFFADNERGKRLRIQLAGERFELPASGPNGHFETELALPPAAIAKYGFGFEAVLAGDDPRRFVGRTHLETERGVTVISDLDDTVKVTEVHELRALLDNTLFRDFRAVPGMAAKYSEWAAQGAAIHFVSSSPWQLEPEISAFLQSAAFPPAVLHLKSVRVKDETLLELWKPGTQTKPRQIEPILEHFPGRRFVLVGDSGEQDPEVYAALMKRFPKQIVRIYIRNVTQARPDDVRFRALFRDVPAEKWALFTDPRGLKLPAVE